MHVCVHSCYMGCVCMYVCRYVCAEGVARWDARGGPREIGGAALPQRGLRVNICTSELERVKYLRLTVGAKKSLDSAL